MEIDAVKTVKVNAKVLRLCCKVRDQFSADLLDQDGKTIAEYEGYVPKIMPGKNDGDYIELDIDIDSGLIMNWVVPTAGQVEAFIADANRG